MKDIASLFSLKGKVALLTGGWGGFGLQCLRALAESGAKTYIASRTIDKLEEVAIEYRKRGFDVTAMQFDQGDEPSILKLRDTIVNEANTIDILVNNAVSRTMKKGWDDTAEAFDLSMHINATGLFVLTRAVGEVMIRHNSGSIINIGSMMGMVGTEYHNYEGTDMTGWYPDYFFHKGGMINFTRFCASYFGRYDIRVNCISPGGLKAHQPQAFLDNYAQRTMLGRIAGDEDLIGSIVFFASDASAYVTGTNLPVDGGYTAK
ncbi:MAG: SDR family oxidoreductase [Sphaerochaetaceae bacterium]|nr:SDR family oxidoreductase [Sphaerochaetaceae bacterium]MDD2406941.1 SDR family oxidoreductase [Sphaerochaetaceae bacterium]MDD4260514.1 SDR family oxidoreductase [Sphaerochaetaceae bacterium]NLO60077.1 SDR family oxidoreductase [Spirochaetales bacterium]